MSDESEQLARQFHEIYERLAPQFGYETRTETRQFDPNTPNGKLMIAVCGEILALREQAGEPIAHIKQNASGQIHMTDNAGGAFDLSRYIGAALYTAPPAQPGAVSAGHASDCAVHNMPAYPNGPCDCGTTEELLRRLDEAYGYGQQLAGYAAAEIRRASAAPRQPEAQPAIDAALSKGAK